MSKNTGIKRLYKACFYSYNGLLYAAKNEAAFRQELVAALVLLPVAIWLVDVSLVERLILIFSVFVVLIIELINTAIEAVVDRVGVELHPLSGVAKDAGSAAVLLALVFAIVAWVAILASTYL